VKRSARRISSNQFEFARMFKFARMFEFARMLALALSSAALRGRC
jgi:hypothetical protein